MSFKQKAIVFDCDDVLLNWLYGFREYHNTTYGTTIKGSAPDYKLFDWMGVAPDVLLPRMRGFNSSWQFACLEPMRYCVDVIHYLRDYNNEVQEEDRIKLIILSKCGNNPETRKLRTANLDNVFGLDCFDNIILIEGHESKKPMLQQLRDRYNVVLFVDDYVGNCNDGDDIGIKSVVIQQQHNKHMKELNPHLHFCRDWMHLFSIHIAKHIRVE